MISHHTQSYVAVYQLLSLYDIKKIQQETLPDELAEHKIIPDCESNPTFQCLEFKYDVNK